MFGCFLFIIFLALVDANDCEAVRGGTCINSQYNSCLTGYYYSMSGCDFQEMCCIPPFVATSAPPLANGQCGISFPESQSDEASQRIVGGTRAARGEFPWQVSLRAAELSSHHKCGGVIISEKWILTAAHCFEANKNPFAWNAILGEYDRGVTDGHEKLVKLDTLIIHKEFSQVGGGNDIALLRMATENVAYYSAYVRPVCLPSPGESFSSMTCTITGWGADHSGGVGTRYLYKANIPIISKEVCSYLMDRTILPGDMCAGQKMGGVDTCQGDSGGPMVCYRNKRWELAGITSWGLGCAQSYSPGIYTNVSYYMDWVREVEQYFASKDHQQPVGRRSSYYSPDQAVYYL